MADEHDEDIASRLATEIVVAYLENATIASDDLPGLVISLRRALTVDVGEEGDIGIRPKAVAPVPMSDRAPAAPPDQSVFPDYIISLEDGARYRSLKRHLRVKHGMSPEEYRAKWGLPPDYPMVAPNYARERSEVAKRIGLGVRKEDPDADGSAQRGRRRR